MMNKLKHELKILLPSLKTKQNKTQNISLEQYLTFKQDDQQHLSFHKTIQIWKQNPSLIYKRLQYFFKGYQMFSISA